MNKEVIVVGGGAAGMVAAIFAARRGNKVILLEKNEKLGKKLYITGKGRCNLTNDCGMEQLFESVLSNSKFLYSSFYAFSNEAAMRFFEGIGLPLKTERGGRVFPRSDKSSDVIRALSEELKRCGVKVLLGQEVEGVMVEGGAVQGVRLKGRESCKKAKAVILATGGLSYPSTGSTGDGYRFAEELGHKVKELSPSLVPIKVKEKVVKDLQGLSLKNVVLRVTAGDKEIFKELGEMLFTHFGVSGPIVLSASTRIKPYLDVSKVTLHIDLKPGLSMEQLGNRILRDFEQSRNCQMKNALNKLLPKKMIPVIISLSGISTDKRVNHITREERERLLECMKDFPLTPTSLRGYSEAVITRGGIDVKEVNPRTMESRKAKGVYFVGEVLDLDALTGGFNLQIAWSTGFMAGNSV